MRRRGSISLPPEMSDVKIMLLGSTGSGKSASGNTIIGVRGTFKEDLSLEETRVCESAQTVLNGQSITVIDTAGLSDTSVKITDAQTQIEKMLQGGVDVFLLVIKLGQTFTETDSKVVKWIQDNFGEKFSDHAIVLFTHGDQLLVPIDRYLNKSESLRSIVDRCSKRYHVFNNKDEDPSQVTELLRDINKLRETPGYRRYSEQDYQETQVLFKFSALGAQIHDIGTRLDVAAARAAGAPGGAAGLDGEAGAVLAVVAGLRRAAAAAGFGRAAVEAAGAAVAVGIGGTVFTGPKRGAALAAAVGAGVYFARKYYYRGKR